MSFFIYLFLGDFIQNYFNFLLNYLFHFLRKRAAFNKIIFYINNNVRQFYTECSI